MKKSNNKVLRKILIFFLILLFLNLFAPIVFEGINNYNQTNFKFSYSLYWLIESILILITFICYGYLNKNDYHFTANIDLEKIPDDFNNLYQKIYNQYNEKINIARGNLGNEEIATWTCYALTLITYLGFLIVSDKYFYVKALAEIFLILSIILFFISNILVVARKKKLDKFRNYYKNVCINEILKLINPEIEYNPVATKKTEERLRKVFNECHCYSRSAAKIHAEDSIFLQNNNLKIEFADTKFKSYSKNNLIFEGLFCNATLNSYFKKHIRIKSGSLEDYNDLPIVKLDSDEFEKYFQVQSADTIYAVRMLTADIMEEFIEFYKKLYLTFEVNIYKDMLTIKFFTGSMFEPKLLGEAIDKESLYAYYEIVKFAKNTVMKINTILEEFN